MQAIRVSPVTSRLLHDGYLEVSRPTPRRTKPRPTMDTHFLIIAGLILVNAYFVAAEFALVKVRTSQIDQMVEEGSWAARITSKALDKLDVYLSASQIGITVASLALGRAIEDWVEPLVAGRSMSSRGCPWSITAWAGSPQFSAGSSAPSDWTSSGSSPGSPSASSPSPRSPWSPSCTWPWVSRPPRPWPSAHPDPGPGHRAPSGLHRPRLLAGHLAAQHGQQPDLCGSWAWAGPAPRS